MGDGSTVLTVRNADRRRRLEVALRETYPDDGDAATHRIGYARAPGRVNLMGDHTDYNDGLVMPVAIDLDTWIAFRRRRDRLVRIASLQTDEAASFWIDELPDGATRDQPRGGRWSDYVAGTAWSLREAALPTFGFDGIVDSTIPLGAGLGSSAALELASALALLAGERSVAAPYLAALAHRAETEYVGVECSPMDQFASAAGRSERAILLDCRSLDNRYVGMPAGLSIVVLDPGVPAESRQSRAALLAERRAECGRAVALLAEREPGIASLRDLDMATLRRHRHALPSPLARRAEHVVTENRRVGEVAAALAVGDLDAVGRLFAASHESLRSRMEASTPALDVMVKIAASVPGVIAARMTGPGFGGCTVNLVRSDAVPALKRAVATEGERRTGFLPGVYAVAPADGAGPV